MTDTMLARYKLSRGAVRTGSRFQVERRSQPCAFGLEQFFYSTVEALPVRRPADDPGSGLAPPALQLVTFTGETVDPPVIVHRPERTVIADDRAYRAPPPSTRAEPSDARVGLPAHVAAEEQRLLAELPPEHRAQAERFVGRGHTLHEFDSAELMKDLDEDLYQ